MGDSRVNDDLIAIGKVVRVHGVKGELVVNPLTDDAGRFEELEAVYLEGRQTARYDVRALRFHKNQVLILLAGIADRDVAESHVGDFVSVTRDDLIELPEDTFFQFEVLGMKVVTESGEVLGVVEEVIEMPANDLWRIRGERDFTIPASENVVLKVDREAKVITIRLIEGLLDL